MHSAVVYFVALSLAICGCVSVDRDAQKAIAALRTGNNVQAAAQASANDGFCGK